MKCLHIHTQTINTVAKKLPQMMRRWTSRAAGLSVSLQEAMQQVQQPKEATQVGRRGLQPDSEPGGPRLFNSLGCLKSQKANKRKRSFSSLFWERMVQKESGMLQQARSSQKISISVTIPVFIKKCQVHAGSVGRAVGNTWSYRACTWNEKVS